MKYKQKAVFLASLAVVLSVIYVLTFIFDPGSERSSSFAWLPASLLDLADRIEISGPGGTSVLSRKNNIWVFTAGTGEDNRSLISPEFSGEYPVKQAKVNDLLAVLSRKDTYPLRAGTAAAREKLGLGEGSSSRIIVRGGAGLPLLDLYLGISDALGREVYLKRAGKNEIYSGEDRFTVYTDSKPQSWYDLRLFPDSVNIQEVQQAEVTRLEIDETGSQRESFVLRRSGGGWIIPGNENTLLESTLVDAWLRSVLEAEGEDFSFFFPAPANGSIVLWLGDGSTRVIETCNYSVVPAGAAADNHGSPEEDGQKRLAARVSGSDLVYVLSERTANRLFRDGSYFYK